MNTISFPQRSGRLGIVGYFFMAILLTESSHQHVYAVHNFLTATMDYQYQNNSFRLNLTCGRPFQDASKANVVECTYTLKPDGTKYTFIGGQKETTCPVSIVTNTIVGQESQPNGDAYVKGWTSESTIWTPESSPKLTCQRKFCSVKGSVIKKDQGPLRRCGAPEAGNITNSPETIESHLQPSLNDKRIARFKDIAGHGTMEVKYKQRTDIECEVLGVDNSSEYLCRWQLRSNKGTIISYKQDQSHNESVQVEKTGSSSCWLRINETELMHQGSWSCTPDKDRKGYIIPSGEVLLKLADACTTDKDCLDEEVCDLGMDGAPFKSCLDPCSSSHGQNVCGNAANCAPDSKRPRKVSCNCKAQDTVFYPTSNGTSVAEPRCLKKCEDLNECQAGEVCVVPPSVDAEWVHDRMVCLPVCEAYPCDTTEICVPSNLTTIDDRESTSNAAPLWQEPFPTADGSPFRNCACLEGFCPKEIPLVVLVSSGAAGGLLLLGILALLIAKCIENRRSRFGRDLNISAPIGIRDNHPMDNARTNSCINSNKGDFDDDNVYEEISLRSTCDQGIPGAGNHLYSEPLVLHCVEEDYYM